MFDDLLAAIGAGDEEAGAVDLEAALADFDAALSGDADPAGFDELLERVERQRAGAPGSRKTRIDHHDITELPAAATAGTLLLRGPLGSTHDDDACVAALEWDDGPADRVMLVTATPWGDTRLEAFLAREGDRHVEEVLHVGRTGEATPDTAAVLRSAPLSDPDDLTYLGITISREFERWAEGDGRISVCVHSLTALLEQETPRRVFRFLHVLLGRLGDARVHVHVDAQRHDAQDVALFRSLFDVTLSVTAGGVEVQER